jgi:hypothetical protein
MDVVDERSTPCCNNGVHLVHNVHSVHNVHISCTDIVHRCHDFQPVMLPRDTHAATTGAIENDKPDTERFASLLL